MTHPELHPGIGKFPFFNSARRYDVWEYIPMDQGGRLVQLELIGSERDADIVAAVRTPHFFERWGNPIVWDGLEKVAIEKSVWLNRWYYLPSFARLYFTSGDRGFLTDLFRLFTLWSKGNPVPENLEAAFRADSYNWRDMQVAWRTQNLIWSYFLGRDGWSPDEAAALYDSIRIHSRVLLAYFGAQPFSVNNHQSHGAAVLLYAGLLFPDLPDAGAMAETGLAILDRHLGEAFFEDGNSVELAPGYYPFIVSNFRDAFLLCRDNGLEISERWHHRLCQFHDFMTHVRQPDGTMPPVNDSSETPTDASISSLREILEISPRPPHSRWFQASHQAVMRDEQGSYLFLDGGPRILAHWHAGKLGFHCWLGGQPILVDSGVCDYDLPDRRNWFTLSEAHNTLLVDNRGDYDRWGGTTNRISDAECGILNWESTPTFDCAVMEHRAFQRLESPVSWRRTVVLIKNHCVILIDRVESDAFHDYTWPFHFAPMIVRKADGRDAVLAGGDPATVALIPFDRKIFARVQLGDGLVNRQGKNIRAPVVKYTARQAKVTAAFVLLPLGVAGSPRPALRQKETFDGLSLKITTSSRRIRLFLSNDIPKIQID